MAIIFNVILWTYIYVIYVKTFSGRGLNYSIHMVLEKHSICKRT